MLPTVTNTIPNTIQEGLTFANNQTLDNPLGYKTLGSYYLTH